MKEVLNVGVIGLGNRGSSLLENCILPQPGVRVLAVCDNYEDRREKGMQLVTCLLYTSRKKRGWKMALAVGLPLVLLGGGFLGYSLYAWNEIETAQAYEQYTPVSYTHLSVDRRAVCIV